MFVLLDVVIDYIYNYILYVERYVYVVAITLSVAIRSSAFAFVYLE